MRQRGRIPPHVGEMRPRCLVPRTMWTSGTEFRCDTSTILRARHGRSVTPDPMGRPAATVRSRALGILAFTSARSPVARPLALAAPPATSSASRGHHGRAPRWATRASRHGLRPHITDGALPRDDPHGRAPSRCLGASGRVRLGGQASSRPAARWTNSMREFSISARVSGSL